MEVQEWKCIIEWNVRVAPTGFRINAIVRSMLSLGMIPTWLYIPVVNGACMHDNHV